MKDLTLRDRLLDAAECTLGEQSTRLNGGLFSAIKGGDEI
jgi:hypothetical protein